MGGVFHLGAMPSIWNIVNKKEKYRWPYWTIHYNIGAESAFNYIDIFFLVRKGSKMFGYVELGVSHNQTSSQGNSNNCCLGPFFSPLFINTPWIQEFWSKLSFPTPTSFC